MSNMVLMVPHPTALPLVEAMISISQARVVAACHTLMILVMQTLSVVALHSLVTKLKCSKSPKNPLWMDNHLDLKVVAVQDLRVAASLLNPSKRLLIIWVYKNLN